MMYKKILFLALVTFFLAGIASAADPNLVGWYKFDEGTGTVVADSSDYGNDATLSSDTGWDTGGYDAGCLNFDATFTVSVPAAVFADVKEQVTISLWVNGDTDWTGTSGQVAFHGAGPLRGRALHAEIPGGASSIWFAAGDTTSGLNDGYDQSAWWSPPVEAYKGTWNNFTFVKNNIADVNEPTWMIYWNGLMKATEDDLTAAMDGIDTFVIGSRIDGDWDYYGKLDEFKIFDKALSRQEIADMLGVDLDKATNPRPIDGQEQIPADALLNWDAGLQAASHDVYLGTDETAVTNATNASAEFMDNVADNQYDPCGLDPNALYYWRVDEINDVDLWTGDVWSFKVIPPVPPMPEPILWLKMDGVDPESARLVTDSSGNGMDGTMGSSDTWIEIPGLGGAIDFDGGSWGASGIVFDVNDINDILAPSLDQTVTVSFWCTWDAYVDGANYPYDGRMADRTVNQGRLLSSECPTLNHLLNHCGLTNSWKWQAFNPTNPSFFGDGGTWGDYKRFTFTGDLTTGQLNMYVDNNLYNSETKPTSGLVSMSEITEFTVGRTLWAEMEGDMTDFRLYNEVLRPEHIAELVGDYPKQAKIVSPTHESEGHLLDADLVWRAGTDANSHDVYFDENYAAVRDADTSSSCYMGQQTTTTYDPCGLELAKTYYWRIDEVDAEDAITEGPVWQFD
ncbi:MAG: LamG domain-containing protein, partial [Planctomycetes bacterium]|nr:LamG domain-containing protein [Planctomycetota bacterium]